jgi:hypothetical protein
MSESRFSEAASSFAEASEISIEVKAAADCMPCLNAATALPSIN